MTAPQSSTVQLFVGPAQRVVDVWSRYDYTLSMLEVGNPFTFSFWYSTLGQSAWRALLDPATGVKCGHRVTLAVDGDAVLSGIVETRVVGDQGTRRNEPVFVISGRDLLGPAVSWDADPTLTLRGRALTDALTDLYRSVGITVDIGVSVDPGTRVSSIRVTRARKGSGHKRHRHTDGVRASHPRIGEHVHAIADRIVRSLGYRMWTTPGDGDAVAVIVDRPRTTGARLSLLREMVDGRISDRSNLWSGRETTSISNMPTSVTVFSDAQRGNNPTQKIARTVENGFLFTEEAAARVDYAALSQPRYVQSRNATTEAGAHNEAARLCASANEGFRRYECTVLGHRQDGRLLVPNMPATVADDLLGVAEPMLLVTVRGAGDREGAQTTELTLLPEGALSVIPEPEPT